MNTFLYFLKYFFFQCLVCATLFCTLFLAIWINPSCQDEILDLVFKNQDIKKELLKLIGEVRGLLLN